MLLDDLTGAVLPPDFFEQRTLEIARQLLGRTLVVVPDQDRQAATAGIIVETEGYIAPEDPACHAYMGRTARNDVMWGEPGRAYIYFTYGNHWMINLVTGPAGLAAAVLIRAVQPLLGLELMRQRRALERLKSRADDRQLTSGPGKLCQAMDINGRLNRQPFQGPQLYLSDTPASLKLPPFETVETTRIGISRGQELPWRYYVRANPYVSRY